MEKRGGGGRRTVVSFRGFRGKYRLGWTCPKCGQKHVREVWLTGAGVVEKDSIAVPCRTDARCIPIRDYTVDGRSVSLSGDETTLELARLYPKDAVKGEEGVRWAEVAVTVVAPKDGVYRMLRVNDYYGKLVVNGTVCGGANGPFEVADPLGFDVSLKAGVNRVALRTRAGTSGSWRVGLFLPVGSPLSAK